MLKSCLLATLATLAACLSLATQALPPEVLTIDDCVTKKSAVEFPHKLHFDQMECSSCHHNQPDLTMETADQAQPCGSCHTAPESADTPSCSQMSLKKNPFHISCMGCHKQQDAGPKKCKECHPKAE